jgi:hypothetical protein
MLALKKKKYQEALLEKARNQLDNIQQMVWRVCMHRFSCGIVFFSCVIHHTPHV